MIITRKYARHLIRSGAAIYSFWGDDVATPTILTAEDEYNMSVRLDVDRYWRYVPINRLDIQRTDHYAVAPHVM